MEVLTVPYTLTLGQKVRVLRLVRGWAQYELAVHAETTQNAVSALERDRFVYPAARRRILAALGLDDEVAA